MNLTPDITLLYQLGIFIVVYFILKFLVFNPVLKIIEKRRELTVGMEQQAKDFSGKTEKLIEEYSQNIQKARQQGIEVRDVLRKEGEAQAGGLMAKAREELEASGEKSRQTLSQETKTAEATLQDYSRKLSTELAEKLLGRKVSS